MTAKEAIKYFERILLHVDMRSITGLEAEEAINMAISALEAQERAESLYQMACERINAVDAEPSKYDLGRISALADATGHTAQSFSPD